MSYLHKFVVFFFWFCLSGMGFVLISTIVIGRFKAGSRVIARSELPRRFWTTILIFSAMWGFAVFQVVRVTRAVFKF